jgi:hypothetical protein
MGFSIACIDRGGRRFEISHDIANDVSLANRFVYLHEVCRNAFSLEFESVRRIHTLRHIGQALGQQIAEVFLADGRVALRIAGPKDPLQIHQLLLYGAIGSMSEDGILDALRRLYTSRGEMHEILPRCIYDGFFESMLTHAARAECLGIVVAIDDRRLNRFEDQMRMMELASMEIGVPAVRLRDVPGDGIVSWRRPQLVLIGHENGSGRVQVGEAAVDIHRSIIPAYAADDYQVDLRICYSREYYASSEPPDVYGQIVSTACELPFKSIFRGVQEMLRPTLAHEILGLSNFSYLDGSRNFVTIRFLICALFEGLNIIETIRRVQDWRSERYDIAGRTL